MGTGNIEVIVGTSEEYLLGYKIKTKKDGHVELSQTFADHSHMGSVRQVAVGGKFLVSGASDETLRIFNLDSRTAVGTIMEHQGTITHVSFHKSKYLFSAAEDGNICIYSRRNWKCDKTLKGHKGMVLDVSVHPSGKLALSVGQDATLRTWNLIKGRKAYITNLKTAACGVYWSPSGMHYLIVRGSCVEVYEVAMAKLVHTVDFKQQVAALVFITDELIAVGGEGHNICLYDVSGSGTELLQWEAHRMRVKCLEVLPEATATPGLIRLVSASSDGTIKIWAIDLLSLSSPKLMGEVNTTCRITCMDVYVPLDNSTSASPLVTTEDIPSSGGEEEDDDVDEEEEAEDKEEEVEDEKEEAEEEEEEAEVEEEEAEVEEEGVENEEEETDEDDDEGEEDEQEKTNVVQLLNKLSRKASEKESGEKEVLDETFGKKSKRQNGATQEAQNMLKRKRNKKQKSKEKGAIAEGSSRKKKKL